MIGRWFECKVSLKRTLEDGLQKQVKETYIVDALNFTDAEARLLQELRGYGDITIQSIKFCDAKEIVDSHNPNDGYWYKVKVSLITIDESKGKEKKVNVIIYVRAADFKGALQNTEEYMKTSVMDYSVISIVETNIMDVFEYSLAEKKE